MANNYAAGGSDYVLIVSKKLVAQRSGKPRKGDCVSATPWRARELVEAGEYLYAAINTIYKTPGVGAVENISPNHVQIYVYGDDYRGI